jgi:uncharacterized membrane protein
MDEAHEEITVDAPAARCFGVAVDFEEYPTWAKELQSVVVLERDADGRGSKVEFRASALGRRIRWSLAYDFTDAPSGFSWSLVEGDLLRRLDGRYGFSPEDSATRVTYDLVVELAVPLPGMLRRQVAGIIMGNALRGLKQEAER